jgi:hypothetical protein
VTKERDVIAQALDALADLIAERVWVRFQQGTPDMVDQSKSPLGNRRHCNAVKRRVGNGEPGAARVGRRYLLTPEALAEELHRLGQGPPPKRRGESVADELRRELGLIRKAAGR